MHGIGYLIGDLACIINVEDQQVAFIREGESEDQTEAVAIDIAHLLAIIDIILKHVNEDGTLILKDKRYVN